MKWENDAPTMNGTVTMETSPAKAVKETDFAQAREHAA
jgi:hypothetical protein